MPAGKKRIGAFAPAFFGSGRAGGTAGLLQLLPVGRRGSDAGERSFFRQLKRQAARRLEQLESGSHAPDRKPCPLKAGVEIGTDDKALTAWIFLFPPLLGAGDITPEEIRSALKEQGIVFGVDEGDDQTLCSGPVYLKLAVIARGTGPVAGRDGWIRDYVPRERPKNFFAETERTVDYKSLNLYRQINAGDLICEIVPPEPPVPGKDVKGQVIPGKEGRLPRLPGGRNTLVSQDGLRLTAKTDGQILFKTGSFRSVRLPRFRAMWTIPPAISTSSVIC